MQTHRVILLSIGVIAFTCLGVGQDSQSLGDAARQARLKKKQQETTSANAAQDKDGQAKDSAGTAQPLKQRVITNDEIPSHIGPTSALPSNVQAPVSYEPPSNASGRSAADTWKVQIQAMKSRIASLAAEMARVNESVRFASGNCVRNCVQHNEQQLQKQEQVENMRAQLEEQQKQLEQMQETARRQGFGSSVYDP